LPTNEGVSCHPQNWGTQLKKFKTLGEKKTTRVWVVKGKKKTTNGEKKRKTLEKGWKKNLGGDQNGHQPNPKKKGGGAPQPKKKNHPKRGFVGCFSGMVFFLVLMVFCLKDRTKTHCSKTKQAPLLEKNAEKQQRVKTTFSRHSNPPKTRKKRGGTKPFAKRRGGGGTLSPQVHKKGGHGEPRQGKTGGKGGGGGQPFLWGVGGGGGGSFVLFF